MSPTFRALHNRNYRLYFAGSMVSNTGTWMMRIAQDWLVLALGGGAGALGIVTGLQFLPVLMVMPYAGSLADRFPKRRMLQWTQAAMAVISLVLGVVALSGHAQVWMVCVLAFGFGIAAAFDVPARQSFVSEMVGPDDLTNAVGLNSASFNSARLIGPALAGLVIGALGSGPQATGVVMLLNAASYAMVIYALQRMNPALLLPSRPVPRQAGMVRAGFAYVRTQPKMVLILVIVFFAGTFGVNFQITSALMATEVYGKGAGEFGLLGSVVAVGSLTGALLAARRSSTRLRLLFLAAAGFGLTVMLAGLMPTFVAFALISPVIGIAMMTMMNAANTLIQLESDPQFRGRALAIYMMVMQGGTPLGAPITGWIAAVWGPRVSMVIGGGLSLLGVVLAVGLLLWFRRRPAGSVEPVVASAATLV
ncbi:MFS transporter [soil metagenome]